MREPFTGPIFTVDGLAFLWDDVLLHARATGRWDALEHDVRLGLAAAAASEAEPDDEVEAFVDAQGDEWRYERDLLTAAEMEQWLEARGATVRAWLDFLRGWALRQLWADRADELLARHAPDDAALAAALDLELALTEQPLALAEALAADAALAAAARGWATPPADRRLLMDDIVASATRRRDELATPDALAREVQARRMEWVRMECVLATFADVAQAREAVLCVKEDREPLAQVAADAHVESEEVGFILDDLEPDLRSRFLAAQPGDIVGPVERDGAQLLFQVTARHAPDAADPELRERARRHVEARAVNAELERRVRWVISRADAA